MTRDELQERQVEDLRKAKRQIEYSGVLRDEKHPQHGAACDRYRALCTELDRLDGVTGLMHELDAASDRETFRQALAEPRYVEQGFAVQRPTQGSSGRMDRD